MTVPVPHNRFDFQNDALFTEVVKVEVDTQADTWERDIGRGLTEEQRFLCVRDALAAVRSELALYHTSVELRPEHLTRCIQREVVYAIFQIVSHGSAS